ncbi:MAG: hypothetical protein CFE44_25640 [Burkholderiales bacterium PBB4]|nr:MAG: hypothetical protein CFE44_25640 [Burkholderiales bacterium PBB4]
MAWTGLGSGRALARPAPAGYWAAPATNKPRCSRVQPALGHAARGFDNAKRDQGRADPGRCGFRTKGAGDSDPDPRPLPLWRCHTRRADVRHQDGPLGTGADIGCCVPKCPSN